MRRAILVRLAVPTLIFASLLAVSAAHGDVGGGAAAVNPAIVAAWIGLVWWKLLWLAVPLTLVVLWLAIPVQLLRARRRLASRPADQGGSAGGRPASDRALWLWLGGYSLVTLALILFMAPPLSRMIRNGQAMAQYNQGCAYATGRGAKQDYAEALKWFRLAASKGFAPSQAALGWMFETGQGVRMDYAEALRWYHLAAAQGNAQGESALGRMYALGQGVEQDYAEAVDWSRQAAAQGDADAQVGLAWMYSSGRGVNQDDAQAVEWYRKAAAQGHAYAQWALGWAYANGRGVKQDEAEAIKWYRLAAAQGDSAAREGLKALQKR